MFDTHLWPRAATGSMSTCVTVRASLELPDRREFARLLIDAPAPPELQHERRRWRRDLKTTSGAWCYRLITPTALRRRRTRQGV